MSKDKVLVLGANSFSGQDFVDLVLSSTDDKVIGISRSPERTDLFLSYKLRKDLSRYRYFALDMNKDMNEILRLIDSEKPEYIINFAAQSEVDPSWESPADWFVTNNVALAYLINHLRNCDYLNKYLHISSPEVYGNCIGVINEESIDNPSTPYAVSKAAADMLLRVYHKQYNFPVSIIRATNVYGARQQLFKIIPRTAIYLNMGKSIGLHGGGAAIKSYIHVRDVSRGELMVLKSGVSGAMYHLSPDKSISVRDVVELICRHMGKDINEHVTIEKERPGQDAAYVIDSSKIRHELDWIPLIDIDNGISEVTDWILKYWAEIQKESLVYNHKS